ncbi:MAG: hypothetical protein HQM16_12975 [Deltaproteobacteria bacterium]|nr:hypothetical protein [Deltaproteobacteria bacterium]
MKENIVIKKPTPHQALHEFIIYAEHQVPLLIHNIKIIRKNIPFDLKNPILSFLLNRTCNQVLEELVLRIREGWEILNIELKALNQAILLTSDQDYIDLDALRNKLIAHRVQTGIYAKENFTEWYAKKYGSHDAVFQLIERVSQKMIDKIHEIEAARLLNSNQASVGLDNTIQEKDITSLLNALKQAGIY